VRSVRSALVFFAAFAVCAASAPAQESLADAARRKTLDQLLDLYVRNGDVYYRALKAERAKLDGYLNQVASASVGKMSREEQIAFWLNAYNAIVLRTVVDHYPIQGHSPDYPSKSIRQIPGAFERLQHRVGGRMVTLDQIEKEVLPTFNDPRVYFALGRGAIGSGRLRSEAFAPTRIEDQLTEVAAECVQRGQCVQIDPESGKVGASAIFSWREKEFSAVYADKAPQMLADRSPIERAVIGFVYPKLLNAEKDLVAKNAFQLVYKPFDWSLNDLTGRGGR